eukprot:12454329-Alexandrium_andersonii.AAC.1
MAVAVAEDGLASCELVVHFLQGQSQFDELPLPGRVFGLPPEGVSAYTDGAASDPRHPRFS